MKMTGSILKENRERKGITLSEVSIATKITLKTLKSIEDGDRDALPPRTFVRGFVKSYAQYLGLNVQEILASFSEEMGDSPNAASSIGSPSAQTQSSQGQGSETASTSSSEAQSVNPEQVLGGRNSVRQITAAAGVLLLLIFIALARQKMSSYEAEKISSQEPALIETADQSVEVKETPADVVAPSVQPVGSGKTQIESAEPPAKASVNAATEAPEEKQEPKPEQKPEPELKKVEPKVDPPPKAEPPPSPKPAVEQTTTSTSLASPRAKEVLIEALGQVELELILDGEPPKKLSLKADQVQSIKVQTKAVLKLSDGGRVNLVVDGIDRGVPGDLGKPKRVELP